MKKSINILIILLLLGFSATAQMSSINTSPQDALQKKFKTFIALDENTGYVLAQKPVLYDISKEMPLSYFTLFLAGGITKYIPGSPRLFLIHTLQNVSSLAEQDWVLENNLEEESVFFARNKYINNNLSKQWLLMVDGQKLVFKNIRTNDFLSIDEDGNYLMVTNFAEASRWKLIYTY